ncbi:hypothetical protein EYY60_21730 [Flavobacterium zhairuonense]|uniref:hypothetical protein n=1 Tax=Flavobacterium zhairuonense TaxID=2493631 RepID=UPI0010447EAA|nr:hypothetical protein [Flavobacterium zhairuonense]KAF2507130.1 hypothetical protein EYY60_21730 [Flavobacterium zhairuonense]
MPTNPIPAVPIPTARYYPRLSEVITVDDLPEFLSFVENGLNSIFDKIHYKNLQYSKGYRGDSAFYSLDIVTSSPLALELPFDLKLVLNPDLKDGDQSISSFPITLEYQWEILAFLKTFSSSSFSFSIKDFYSVGLQVFRISEEQVIAHMMNIFVEAEEGKTKYEQLLADINTFEETITNDPLYQELEFPENIEQSIQSLIDIIKTNPLITKSIPLLFFGVYIAREGYSLNEIKQKLQDFYNIVAPDGIEAHIKRIITPKAKATLELSAGIEFPQSILKPVNPNGSAFPNQATKSTFVFAKAQLYADTEAGIGYQAELGGALTPPNAMIGNTGLMLELDTLKVDLSKKTNIPEADADGRPNDFVGVYARAASVTLPSKWFHEPKEGEEEINNKPTLKIGTSNLLVGSGGLSGNIYLETVPEPKNGSFTYFNDKFDFYYPITMFEKDEANGVVNEKEIADYPALLVYLQKLYTAKLPYTFKFPLALKTKAELNSSTIYAGTDYSFDNALDYQTFLSELEENMLWKTIGSDTKGFKVGFNKFDITFKQNKVVNSNIKGALEIPKLTEQNGNPLKVGIEGHLYDDGDFNLTASFSKDNKPKANLFNLVNLDFHTLELGKQDEDYYLGTSCYVSFQDSLMGNLLKGKGFEVEKLRVYSDGNIEVDGGSIPIHVSLSVNLGPVQMAVTNINFGSTQINDRKFNFWGFDGAISINPLGVDARGEGIKYYYPVDGDSSGSFIRIQTIEVDLIIPGTATEASAMAIINGMISLPEPGKSKEFTGEVSLKLPKAKISGSVGMSFMPKYPAFLIDASIELPVPIPLGFLAINAFRGLLGFRYVATKEAVGLTKDDSWYEYYKHPKPGINLKKFSGPPDSMQYNSPFSIGAGATFGTVADGGHVLSLRAMLLLSLPTLFYIEAGLNVISGRLGLIEDDPSNPPFFAMVAFGDDSLELAAGADFSIPKDGGQIFKLTALLEAGFFFKNQKPWYVNFGTKDKPIEAEVLTLFKAKAFIMLSAQGIEAGARLDFKLQQSFGPAKVKLWAYLEMGGKISFKRPQMGGYIIAGGGIQIKLLIINVEIALNTIFSVESFKPFLIYAKLELSVRIKIALVRVSKKFTVELQWDLNRVIDRTPYSPLPKGTVGDGEDDRTLENVKGVHMLTNQAFALDYFKSAGEKNYDDDKLFPDGTPRPEFITSVIPLDTYIDIKMAKGLIPNAELSKKVGGYTGEAKNYTDMMPPEGTSKAGRKLRQVKHEYGIKSINLKSWNGSEWVDYNPFEAIVKDTERTKELKDLPWAHWQKAIDQYDSIRVLATNPFSFLSAAEPGWHVPEQLGITSTKLFCASTETEKQHMDFLNKQIGTRYYVPMQYEADKINGLFFKLIGELPVIVDNYKLEGGDFMSITTDENTFGYNRSLSFRNDNELEIIFPESAIDPELNLTTQAKEIKVTAYTASFNDDDKLVSYVPVSFSKTKMGVFSEEQTYTKAELLNTVTLYTEEIDNQKKKIDKIIISPLSAKAKRIKEIRNEIAALFDDTYSDLTGETEITLTDPVKIAKYNSLMADLAILKLDAGNENANTGGNPNALTFTHYYGYNGSTLYDFDQVIKFNDSYVITFHPKEDAKTTILLHVNSDGTIIRERLINGIVTSLQVVNGNLLITQALNAEQCKGIGEATIDLDFIVGCISPIAATAIVEMDEELNPILGTQYLNTYSLNFNKILPLANNDLLWINNTASNETQINWIKGSDRTVIYRSKINSEAIKVLELNENEFSLITKDKKVIRLSVNNASKVISATDTKVISSTEVVEIVDAIIANNKTLLSVKLSNGKFALAQIDGNTISLVKNDSIFDSAVYLSNQTLNDNSVVAYNTHYLFVLNETLTQARLIKRETNVADASIIQIQNEPSLNEILMLSSKPKEKGVYFSLFSDAFDNCSLHPAEQVSVTGSTTALTSGTVNYTTLDLINGFDFRRNLKESKIIATDAIICSSLEKSEDPELDYTTYIQSVDWFSKEEYYHNQTILDIPAVDEQFQAMKHAVETIVQPIWRPNTTYCLDFTLTDTVDDNKKNPVEFKYYYGFKTLGPIGHFPVKDPEKDAPVKNELTALSKSPLTSLRNYLDYNRSYPNADGSLLQSKPSFYGNEQCDISLFFTSTYTSHMFKNWAEYESERPEIEGKLNLFIKDPLTDLLIKYPIEPLEEGEPEVVYPKPIESDEDWTDDNDPRIPLGVRMLNNFIGDPSTMRCILDLGQPLKPKSLKYKTTLTNLKPSKLYTVLVNNFFDGAQIGISSESKNILVHQFGFQTSRYKNFEEQVQSYFVNEEKTKGALYDVNVNLDQERIDALHYLIAPKTDNATNALSDSMATKYQHLFDRATEGILKLSPLDPAQGTEVNRIIDTNTGATIALLIRNPEPFNIPKMPLEEIQETISVLDELENSISGYSVLHSKDYSQALIMHNSKIISGIENLKIRFKYKMWNNDGNGPLTNIIDTQILPLQNTNL